jgi:hypothetical protein
MNKRQARQIKPPPGDPLEELQKINEQIKRDAHYYGQNKAQVAGG